MASKKYSDDILQQTASTENLGSKKTKNILFLIYWYELGGAESYALYTVKLAQKMGHTCYVISSVGGPGTDRHLFDRHCAETLDISDIGSETDFPAFISDFVARKQIDILHIHHSALMYRSLPAIKQLYPALITLDSTHIVEYEDGGFPQLSAQYSDHINKHNVISKSLIEVQRELYRQQYGAELPIEKFNLTYLSALFESEGVRPRRTEGRAKRISFYGRLVRQKQPNLFIAVVERLLKRHPDLNAEAYIYGEGEMQDLLLARIAKSRFKTRFVFCGRCDDKDSVFKNTDIHFLPSLNEGLSLTAYEALAYEILTVSSDVGAQSELLCEECLIPLDASFVEAASERLYSFLTDEGKYRNALCENLVKLKKIREHEASERAIELLYSSW
jgi:glycosyltransferase involved in cell wall biosynthesis